ncbi:putative protein with domain of unknown function (DUF1996) [Lyophyllum shimeji]|uniref:DUF1996 domain-containing protein n=1 Tax=Lyophyllum shimeji TaxID=47721 RepID=A0A9P3UPQ4_LYOSH|nr:putative protein with domain of unknown function (DUF1996) [Lyophyllum shimeji]
MKFTPALASLLVALVSSGSATAWFRVACTGPLVQERVDPIISPISNPSNHVHTVHGASNFACNSTYDTLRASQCTSCLVKQDLSNYWFPRLYFQDPKTKLFEPVSNGGLLVYYQNRGDGDVRNGGKGLKAFPPGFKMLSGNPRARSKKYPEGEGSQGELRERAIQWSCLRYPSNAGYDGHGFPTSDCEAGFNARIHMPACWDGVNVDSPDHMSHTAYLSGLDNGSCPPTHPVYLMKLFYEITWDVHAFASRWNPSTDKWPFVYATGDPTGYSWHGDFQNGWDTTALQNAIDKCNNPNDQTNNGVTEACSYLTVQQASVADTCRTNPVVNEPIDGTLSKLPGCNPIQPGPGDATLYSSSNCPF